MCKGVKLLLVFLALVFNSIFVAAQTISVTIKFATPPTQAGASFADLKYNKQAVFNFELDDNTATTRNALAFFQGGVAPEDGVDYPGLFFDDGCGQPIGYRGAVAVNARSNYNNSEIVSAPTKLNVQHLQTLVAAGFLIENHGYYHGVGDAYIANGFTHYLNIQQNTNYIYDKTGFITRVWVTPSDDTGYNKHVKKLGYLAATSEGVTDGFPTHPANSWGNNLADVSEFAIDFNVFKRDFTDQWQKDETLHHLNQKIDLLLQQSSASVHKLFRLGTHGCGDKNWVNFKAFMQHIAAVSQNRLWVTSLQELLEYLEVKRTVVKTESLSGNELTILLDLSQVPIENFFKDMTLNIGADAAIENITVSGADAFSANPGTGQVNIYKKSVSQPHPLFRTLSNAGATVQLLFPTQSASLKGVGVVPAGATATYQWSQVSGSGSAVFSNSNAAATEVSGLVPGAYELQFTVFDSYGGRAADTVLVQVQKAVAPGRPVRIQAEAFLQMSGVQTENTSDAGGGKNVGWIDNGDWMDYSIIAADAGTYQLALRVATPNNGAKLLVKKGTTVLAPVNLPSTGGYQNWQTAMVLVPLAAGEQTFRIESAANAGFNLNWLEFSAITNPLPVTFTFFNAACNGAGVDLLWKTAQEQNSKYFAVQKSTDGTKWNTIATVPAAGQSTTERSYHYSDKNAAANSLYRIAEYDVDGRNTMSATIKSNCTTAFEFSLLPTFVRQTANLKLRNAYVGSVKVLVYNSSGVLQLAQQLSKSGEMLDALLNLERLSSGKYIIAVQLGSQEIKHVIVKL